MPLAKNSLQLGSIQIIPTTSLSFCQAHLFAFTHRVVSPSRGLFDKFLTLHTSLSPSSRFPLMRSAMNLRGVWCSPRKLKIEMLFGNLFEFTLQIGLLCYLLHVSSSLPTVNREKGKNERTRVSTYSQLELSVSKLALSQEEDVLLVRKARWLVNLALVRHIAVIASVLWHITSTPSPPVLSFGADFPLG